MTMANLTTAMPAEGAGVTPPSDVVYYANLNYPVTLSYLITQLILGLIGLVTAILNAIVMYALGQHITEIETEQYFIFCMAVIDFVTGLNAIHFSIYNLVNFQDVVECFFRVSMLGGMVMSTGWMVLFMAINRLVHVAYPYHYDTIFSRKKTIVYCIIPFIVGFHVPLLPVLGWRYDFIDPVLVGGYECILFLLWKPSFIIYKTIFFNIPIVFNCVVYCAIFKIAHGHAKAIAVEESRFHDTNKKGVLNKQILKYTKTIAIVVVIYQVMFLPNSKYFSALSARYLGNTPCKYMHKSCFYQIVSIFLHFPQGMWETRHVI